jgi:hypothetical protein
MTGLVALEFRRSLEHARERRPKLGCRQLWATDHMYGLPVQDRGLQRRGARRAASRVLRQQTESYGSNDGEASQQRAIHSLSGSGRRTTG